MSKSPAFILSNAVNIELDGDTLNITHDGDVVIEQTLGLKLGRIQAGGDLTVRLETITGTLRAKGAMRLHGQVEADSLHADEVILTNQSVKCRAISADRSITIGAANLKVDAIVAPHIDVDPSASGRVTVIQSHNDRAATRIKGGFSIADYDDMFGDAEAFLSDRGLSRLGEPSKSPAPRPTPTKAAVDQVALAPTMADEEDDDEDIDDPLSLSLDDLEPLVESGDEKGDLQARLKDALKRITSCYDGADTPPAVNELSSLIEDGDMDALRSNITEVWNGLLGFHQKRGIRPHHQVTHAFNVIHSLVS